MAAYILVKQLTSLKMMQNDAETPRLEKKCTITKVSFLLMLYFVQGLPFGLQEKFLPIYFRVKGYDYTRIFFFRLIHLPWMCKMLWAPFVDQIENKRKCVAITLFLLTLCNLLASYMDPDNCMRIAAAMLLINFVVSFQDVALDTLALTILSDSELGQGNSAQVIGYKLGMTVGSGGFAYMTFQWGLQSVFLLMAVMQLWALGGFILSKAFKKPSVGIFPIPLLSVAASKETWNKASKQSLQNELKQRKSNLSESQFPAEPPMCLSAVFPRNISPPKSASRNFLSSQYSYTRLFQIRGTPWLIFFVLTYKLGEAGVLSMFPLFLVDAGIQEDIVFWWNGIVGHLASILGSIVGGQLSSNRNTIFQNLVYFCIVRFALILFLTLVVLGTNEPFQDHRDSIKLMCSLMCLTFLSFVSGLITTITFTLMMMSSQKAPRNYQAFYYSALSTMEVAGKLAFIIGMGPLIDQYGEDVSFLTCFVISLAQLPILSFYPDILR
uniref:Major facilitator superfamily (MFS) profile domain-containing protein n=1 Tax=Strigamia maritima TaxID=126957 RepID=T1J909_STRMM